ncbi:MAG: hypothetical protein BWY07_02633 [Candidatus Hydrogenedentes bacterium ADurb.Bin170]|nr:MAG: hypothetical protein BWY07_02633 [Candidatus Hydrogenedentes bacterium ADurb.Bin170]
MPARAAAAPTPKALNAPVARCTGSSSMDLIRLPAIRTPDQMPRKAKPAVFHNAEKPAPAKLSALPRPDVMPAPILFSPSMLDMSPPKPLSVLPYNPPVPIMLVVIFTGLAAAFAASLAAAATFANSPLAWLPSAVSCSDNVYFFSAIDFSPLLGYYQWSDRQPK